MRRITAIWPTRRHGALQQLSDNIWRVEGSVPGTLYKRQMIVTRDERERLLLHSAIALEPVALARLESLGTPTWLVVPNGFHRLDAPAYKCRYPGLIVVAPVGSIQRIQKAVQVDQTYADFQEGLVHNLEHAPWPNPREGILQVRSRDGTTLVFNDLLWTPPGGGWQRAIYQLLQQGPQVPLLSKRMLADDLKALRMWLERLAKTENLVRVVPGHGAPITRNASQVLQNIAARL
jgi:hypothetical protein